MTVIMVDDSSADRKLCRVLLEETYGSELKLLSASNGKKGLKLCRTGAPDCVLLDYQLPDMGGVEFIGALPGGAPPVVMLTPLGSDAIAVEALKAGAQDYLVKHNVSSESLRMAIEKAIEKVRLIGALKSERDHLAGSLLEKETLVQEIHHRVKNNLQVIASLLKLQSDALGGRDGNEAAAKALRDSQHRVESMALIHEQLYLSNNLRKIDLARHASFLANSLMQSYGAIGERISLTVRIKPMPLGVDRAVPAGLILNELISNALRHAFKPAAPGLLSIRGNMRAGRIILEISDNGRGFPDAIDPAHPSTLGLQILNILVYQLKGEFSIRRVNGFTRCRVDFPEI